MSKKSSADYLRDMLQELDEVKAFTTGGKAAFIADSKTRKAVIRSYEIIGEIAKRLPEDLRQAHVVVDWRKLIGFRDFLAHHYEEVILDFVWEAVENVPALRADIETVIAALEEEPRDDEAE